MRIEATLKVSKNGKTYFEVHPRQMGMGDKFIWTSGHRSVRDPNDDVAEVRTAQHMMFEKAVALWTGVGPYVEVTDEIEIKQLGEVYLDVWFAENGVPDDGAAITMCSPQSAGMAKGYRVIGYGY